MNKNFKNIVIVSTVFICLVSIFLYKRSYYESLNSNLKKGFEYAVDGNFNIKDEVKDKLPMILVLGATNCGPCKEMQPIYRSLNKEYQGKVKVKYLDLLRYPNLREMFDTRVTPTTLFVNNEGKVKYYIEGATSRKQIVSTLNKMEDESNE